MEDEWDAFKAWERYLAENLRFPFEAVVSEFQDEGSCSEVTGSGSRKFRFWMISMG